MKPLVSAYKPFLFLLALLICLGGCQLPESNTPASEAVEQPAGLDRNPALLQYTRHARCRMGCRHISETEVSDILLHGSVNKDKSDPGDKPCPAYALEGWTLQDHQHVRIIFASCGRVTRVVTCIDLDHDFACSCR